MASNDKTVNVTADANVTSIQININLGNPATGAPELPGNPPKGVLVRHAFTEAGANPIKRVRLSFVPDDATQNFSSHTFDADLAEPTKWRVLLKVPVEFDIDAGVSVLRLNVDGGTVAWLPESTNGEPIFHTVKPKVPNEVGGVSLGDYIRCWNANGADAAAAAHCWDQW
jgi:hypothetical protein